MANADADLRITGINYREDRIIAGEKETFEVVIDNKGSVKSSPYTLVVYDMYGNTLKSYYNKSGLNTYGYNTIDLDVKINERGYHTLRFVIEGEASSDNQVITTVFWRNEEEDYDKIDHDPMDYSNKLIEFIKGYEKFEPEPYTGEDTQNKTIGFGHVIQPGEKFTRITESEAEKLLREDLKSRVKYVNNKIKEHNLKLSQPQFDALVDFVFNKGPVLTIQDCTLFRMLVQQDILSVQELMDAFSMWRKVGDGYSVGVFRRSYDEGEMLTRGDYTETSYEKAKELFEQL